MELPRASGKWTCAVLSVTLIASTASCWGHRDYYGGQSTNADPNEISSLETHPVATADDLCNREGARVTLRGKAYNEKLGAGVEVGDVGIVLAGKHAWPDDVTGTEVIVSGVVVRKDYGRVDDVPEKDRLATRCYGVHWFLDDAVVQKP